MIPSLVHARARRASSSVSITHAPPSPSLGLVLKIVSTDNRSKGDDFELVFEIHVTHGTEATYRIRKRFLSFVKLYKDLKSEFGQLCPDIKGRADTAVGNEDFLLDMRHGFQLWLVNLTCVPDISGSHILDDFVSRSDFGFGNGDENSKLDFVQPQVVKKTIGKQDFSVLKVIGKGSFGQVMLVRKIDTGKVYAMKVLEKTNVLKRNQVEHTKTERNVLETMNHPFIVTLAFAFQTRAKLYLVLEYCSGGELFFHLGNEGRFTEDRTRFYAAEIILALEYLHEMGIVYRDLKPENVLLDGEGHVALTDFGLSKEGINDNKSAHSFCGTPEYLAPEILNRAGHGRAADWWSLGALIYEMLTGIPPFYSRDRERLFAKILTAQLRIPQHLSIEAKSLLRALLTRDPLKRLGSHNDREIREHPFFNDIDFDRLQARKLAPPFTPIHHDADGRGPGNFDKDFANLDVLPDSVEPASYVLTNGNFEGFTYAEPHSLEQATRSLTKLM